MRSELLVMKGIGFALISCNRIEGKAKEMHPNSHQPCLKTSLSWRFSSSLLKGSAIISRRVPWMSHSSYQKDKLLSWPAIHLVPFLKTDSPSLIPFHTVEQPLILPTLVQNPKLLLRLMYLWVNTQAHKDSFSWCIRQFSLASKGVFFSLAACKPRPSSFLGFVTFFQFTIWIFFLFSVDPHKKSRLSLSTHLIILGRKDCILHGITRDDHGNNLCEHKPSYKGKQMGFSTSAPASDLFNDKTKIMRLQGMLDGKPKYFPKARVDRNPRVKHNSSRASLEIFKEKRTRDFLSLTFCPEST